MVCGCLSPGKKVGLGYFAIGYGFFQLFMAIFAIMEAGRFTPFWTPVECTSLHLSLPVGAFTAVHPVTSSFVNVTQHSATVANNGTAPAWLGALTANGMAATALEYGVVAVTGCGTGAPVPGCVAGLQVTGNVGSLVVPSTDAAPAAYKYTKATYDSQGWIPSTMKCVNKNQVALTVKTGTKGNLWSHNPLDGSWTAVGDISVSKEQVLPKKDGDTPGETVLTMGMKIFFSDAITQAVLAATGAPVHLSNIPVFPFGQTHPFMCSKGFTTGKCNLPLYFSVTFEDKVDVSLMGLPDSKTNAVGTKWCGVMAGVTFPTSTDLPTGHPFAGYANAPFLSTVGPTHCKYSKKEILEVMGKSQVALDAETRKGAPVAPEDVKAPFIDDMDPPQADIDADKSKIGFMTTLQTILGFLMLIALVPLGMIMIKEGKAEKEAAEAPATDVENQVKAAA